MQFAANGRLAESSTMNKASFLTLQAFQLKSIPKSAIWVHSAPHLCTTSQRGGGKLVNLLIYLIFKNWHAYCY
jgi:hypothetical protein